MQPRRFARLCSASSCLLVREYVAVIVEAKPEKNEPGFQQLDSPGRIVFLHLHSPFGALAGAQHLAASFFHGEHHLARATELVKQIVDGCINL